MNRSRMNILGALKTSTPRAVDLHPLSAVELAHTPAPLLRRRTVLPDVVVYARFQLYALRRTKREGNLVEITRQGFRVIADQPFEGAPPARYNSAEFSWFWRDIRRCRAD